MADVGRQLARGGPSSLAVAGLVLVAALVGYGVGGPRSGASLHTSMVASAEGAIAATADGRIINIPLDVSWTDAQGSLHDHGRPDCLPPSVASIGPITFGSVDVSEGNRSWQQVFWVSCRP
jgi:subtilisin family serine protease